MRGSTVAPESGLVDLLTSEAVCPELREAGAWGSYCTPARASTALGLGAAMGQGLLCSRQGPTLCKLLVTWCHTDLIVCLAGQPLHCSCPCQLHLSPSPPSQATLPALRWGGHLPFSFREAADFALRRWHRHSQAQVQVVSEPGLAKPWDPQRVFPGPQAVCLPLSLEASFLRGI